MEENKNVHRVQTQQFSKRQEKRNKLGCFFDKLTTICMQQSSGGYMGPSIDDVTHFLGGFLTPPSPFLPILLNRLMA